ncbi:hypothetical protein FQZ97_210620 [compost metagenome]
MLGFVPGRIEAAEVGAAEHPGDLLAKDLVHRQLVVEEALADLQQHDVRPGLHHRSCHVPPPFSQSVRAWPRLAAL